MGNPSFPITINNDSTLSAYSISLKLTLETNTVPISSISIDLMPSDSNTFTSFEFDLDGEKLVMDLPSYILIQGIDRSGQPAVFVQIPMLSPFETKLFTCKIVIPELTVLDAEMKITYLEHSSNPPTIFSEPEKKYDEWVLLSSYLFEPIPDLKKIASGSKIKTFRRFKH